MKPSSSPSPSPSTSPSCAVGKHLYKTWEGMKVVYEVCKCGQRPRGFHAWALTPRLSSCASKCIQANEGVSCSIASFSTNSDRRLNECCTSCGGQKTTFTRGKSHRIGCGEKESPSPTPSASPTVKDPSCSLSYKFGNEWEGVPLVMESCKCPGNFAAPGLAWLVEKEKQKCTQKCILRNDSEECQRSSMYQDSQTRLKNCCSKCNGVVRFMFKKGERRIGCFSQASGECPMSITARKPRGNLSKSFNFSCGCLKKKTQVLRAGNRTSLCLSYVGAWTNGIQCPKRKTKRFLQSEMAKICTRCGGKLSKTKRIYFCV